MTSGVNVKWMALPRPRERGVRFGRKSLLLPETVKEIWTLTEAGKTVPEIIRRTGASKVSVYRALVAPAHQLSI